MVFGGAPEDRSLRKERDSERISLTIRRIRLIIGALVSGLSSKLHNLAP
jgi:hypothetical protein